MVPMSPQLAPNNYSVSAHCPTCQVLTSFDQKQMVTVNGPHGYRGGTYQRVHYILAQCARCERGALAVVPDNGNRQTAVLQAFFPVSPAALPLPAAVPAEIQAEFREAELCAAFKANRAASALYRSVLEKVLKANGYTKGNDPSLRDLQKRIECSAADGVITDARRKEPMRTSAHWVTTCSTTIGARSLMMRSGTPTDTPSAFLKTSMMTRHCRGHPNSKEQTSSPPASTDSLSSCYD